MVFICIAIKALVLDDTIFVVVIDSFSLVEQLHYVPLVEHLQVILGKKLKMFYTRLYG